MPAADALLEKLAARNPHERVRGAVEVAREMTGQQRRALLADLAGRELYCRQLAVTVAAAMGESGHLVAALRDPYPAVRRRALGARGLPDDALVELVADASLADRLVLYARLRRRRQTALADRLLPLVLQRWGDGEAARLLTACSAPVVAEALATLAYAVQSWTLLVLRHPDLVVGHAAAELAPLGVAARMDWWVRNSQIPRALARHRPQALLDLYERFLAGPLPTTVHLHRLLAVDPARVARLVLADPARPRQLTTWGLLTRSVRDRLSRLPDADLGALLHASGPAPSLVVAVLRGLPPVRREAVFDLAYAGRDLTAQVLPEEMLTVLPHERRHAEARRMLALPAVAAETAARLRTTAFLPYAEAVAVLEEATRSAEAEERAYAYELVVRCAARTGDPAAVTDLLAGLKRIRNEQDPVRSRLLAALAEVRPDLFEVAAVGALDGLVRDALDARDCSWQSSEAVVRLVFRMLWQSASADDRQPLMLWALETLERIGGWRRTPMAVDLRRVLRRGQEHAVFDRLRQRLSDGVRRNDPWPLLVFARSLGKRAWHMLGLQELIGRAATVNSDAVVTSAVALWLAPPRGRAEKVAQLVDRDESMLTMPVVLAVAARRSTELIDKYVLAGRRLRGRFGTGKAWWLPAVERAALALWTPGQVDRYAALVHRGVLDTGLDRWRRAALARTAAGLPGRGPAAVADLIAADDVLIAEGALTGLPDGDRPDQALPVLLDNLHTDRARVAVFAASRCARDVPPSQLVPMMSTALAEASKVTVRKEAARLLSLMRVPGTVEMLVAAWHRDGQHRDVRVAVAAALRAWLDDPRSWTVLEAATSGERHAADSVLDARPFWLAERHRERYAALVRRLTRHPEPDVVRRAYLALAAWALWAPGIGLEVAAGVTDMSEGPTWRYAATCAVNPAVWPAAPDLLANVAATLVHITGSDPDAEAVRDLPARQRLRHLVEQVCSRAEEARRQPAPVRRMVDVLRADQTFAAEAARLSASVLWPGPGFVDELLAVADLLAELPSAMSEVDGHRVAAHWEPADVGPGVDALAGREDAAGGLLAVALTRVAGERAGWPREWRDRLRGLRRHPRLQVRHAALAVFTAHE